MHKRLNAILLTIILLIAVALRVYWLGGSSLWSDEGNTWALIGRSFEQIAWNTAADIHPPGYYWALKVWTSVFGATVVGMRSFSAACGVALVYVIYAIGRRLDWYSTMRTAGLLAAFIAAINPFQIYYSQEARMYMLLALESAGLFWALFALMDRQAALAKRDDWLNWPAVGFVLFGAAGLWTHYSFPIILAAAALTYIIEWQHVFHIPERMAERLRRRRALKSRHLLQFTILNAIIVIAFLPWLPTAIDRVLNWPKGGETVAFLDGLGLTLQTLLFGPLRDLPSPLWPWLVAAGILPITGIIVLGRARITWGLAIWLLAPIGLMFGLGLFSDAFLKFLLVASPAWALLIASAAGFLGFRTMGEIGLAVGAIAVALVSLPAYYGNPVARDNYAGIARYVEAVGDPATDLVLLNAPGQQEVWRYYAPDTPVLALPDQRPPDRAATEAALAEAIAGRDRIFALYWATDESDPEGIVETWLDTRAFKGMGSWQGNVRLVTYHMADDLVCTPLDPPPVFGERIQLTEVCRPAEDEAAEEAALVGLRWQALTPLEKRYKMSVQLLDSRGQVAAQQDSEPAGGALPTTDWAVNELVTDNRGIPIPAGAPPGAYRLIVAVYDAGTGERLSVGDNAHVELGQAIIGAPAIPLPLDVLDIPTRVDASLGPVTLAGYGQHKRGFAHAPQTPIAPGDVAEFILYWQAPAPLPAGWLADQQFTIRLGEQVVTMPLAGEGFPTNAWQPGQLVRTVVQLPYDGNDRRATVEVNEASIELKPLP